MLVNSLEDGIKLVMQAYIVGLVGWLFFIGFYVLVKLGIRLLRRWL